VAGVGHVMRHVGHGALVGVPGLNHAPQPGALVAAPHAEIESKVTKWYIIV